MKPLSDAQKRVAIAKDVIAQLEAKKISAATGHFVQGTIFAFIRRKLFNSQQSPEENDVAHNRSIQPYLVEGLEQNQTCSVCAKGAIFIAHIQRFNQISYDQCSGTDERNVARLLPYFPSQFLSEIETLFEGVDYPWNILGRSQFDFLLEYHHEHLADLSPDDRIIHIMKLIITNKGKKVLL